MIKFGGDHHQDTGIVFRIRHYWEIQKVVNRHKSAAHTDSPDGCTGKTCLGKGIHCPSASSSSCYIFSSQDHRLNSRLCLHARNPTYYSTDTTSGSPVSTVSLKLNLTLTVAITSTQTFTLLALLTVLTLLHPSNPNRNSKKGKGFPYSIPSVGPGADPGVQAVSLQVTVSHPPGGRLPLLSARPAVTSPLYHEQAHKTIPIMPCLRTHYIRNYSGHQPALGTSDLPTSSAFGLHVRFPTCIPCLVPDLWALPKFCDFRVNE